MRIGSSALFVSLAVLLAGCAGAPELPPIDPSAAAGCRAPDEAGCERCCIKRGAVCHMLESYVTGREIDGERVYNNTVTLDSCPSGCAPCARCSKRNEEILYGLLNEERECACEGLPIGNDPCLNRQSCQCYCMWLGNLARSCLRP